MHSHWMMRTAGERHRADTGALHRDREEDVTAEKKKQMRLAGGAAEWDDKEGSDEEKQLNLYRAIIAFDICN